MKRWVSKLARSGVVAWAAACTVDEMGADELQERMQETTRRSAPLFTLYFENDTFSGEDRHYSNGVKLSWLSADLSAWGQNGWRRSLVHALPFVNREGTQKNFGFALGQNIYTPQDISRETPDPNDRPYAGWSYLEFSRWRYVRG